MKRLVIVACGHPKIWSRDPRAGPTRARDAYISPYFRDNRRYAEAFADRRLILSAKYGFVDPRFVIPGPDEVTFKRRSTRPISAEAMQAQARRLADGAEGPERRSRRQHGQEGRRAVAPRGIRRGAESPARTPPR